MRKLLHLTGGASDNSIKPWPPTSPSSSRKKQTQPDQGKPSSFRTTNCATTDVPRASHTVQQHISYSAAYQFPMASTEDVVSGITEGAMEVATPAINIPSRSRRHLYDQDVDMFNPRSSNLQPFDARPYGQSFASMIPHNQPSIWDGQSKFSSPSATHTSSPDPLFCMNSLSNSAEKQHPDLGVPEVIQQRQKRKEPGIMRRSSSDSIAQTSSSAKPGAPTDEEGMSLSLMENRAARKLRLSDEDGNASRSCGMTSSRSMESLPRSAASTPDTVFRRLRQNSMRAANRRHVELRRCRKHGRSNSINSATNSSPVVTSSAYSSISRSPAAAFLGHLADATASNASLIEPDMDVGDIVGDYVLGKVVSSGNFSECREAFTSPDGSMVLKGGDDGVLKVAVKIVRQPKPPAGCAKDNPNGEDAESFYHLFEKEISLWRRINHPNIVPLIDVVEAEETLFAFSPWASDGTMYDLLCRKENGCLSESEAKPLFKQVVDAIFYLHEEFRVIHRDIKLENILVNGKHVYLTDLGLSETFVSDGQGGALYGPSASLKSRHCKTLMEDYGIPSTMDDDSHRTSALYRPSSNASLRVAAMDDARSSSRASSAGGGAVERLSRPSTCAGTLPYCAPEELDRALVHDKYKLIAHHHRGLPPNHFPQSDIWSLGVVLYLLLTGSFPFDDDFVPRMQLAIINGNFLPLDEAKFSPEVRDLVSGMLRVDFTERLTIRQVQAHPWFKR